MGSSQDRGGDFIDRNEVDSGCFLQVCSCQSLVLCAGAGGIVRVLKFKVRIRVVEIKRSAKQMCLLRLSGYSTYVTIQKRTD